MKGIPIEHLFPKGAQFYVGGTVNIDALKEKYVTETKKVTESLITIREQIDRLQQEDTRINEIRLRIEGALAVLGELASMEAKKPLQMAPKIPDPSEEVAEEDKEKGD